MTSQNEQERRKKSAMIGGGVLASMAATEGIGNELFEKAESSKMKRSRSWDDFLKKLEPGDTLFHRTPGKYTDPLFGGEGRIKINDLLLATKGDPFFHSSMYKGRGKIIEAIGQGKSMKAQDLKGDRYVPQEIKAYRPSKGNPEKALAYAKKSVGSDYKTLGQSAEHAFGHLFKPGGGPSATPCKGNKICTEMVAEAYPETFRKRFMSPVDMRKAEGMELVGHYGKTLPIAMREKILARGVYPLLKNLKYGVGAGAMAYGGSKLMDYLKDEKNGTS